MCLYKHLIVRETLIYWSQLTTYPHKAVIETCLKIKVFLLIIDSCFSIHLSSFIKTYRQTLLKTCSPKTKFPKRKTQKSALYYEEENEIP